MHPLEARASFQYHTPKNSNAFEDFETRFPVYIRRLEPEVDGLTKTPCTSIPLPRKRKSAVAISAAVLNLGRTTYQ